MIRSELLQALAKERTNEAGPAGDQDAIVPQADRVRCEDARQAAAADRKDIVQVAADELARRGVADVRASG